MIVSKGCPWYVWSEPHNWQPHHLSLVCKPKTLELHTASPSLTSWLFSKQRADYYPSLSAIYLDSWSFDRVYWVPQLAHSLLTLGCSPLLLNSNFPAGSHTCICCRDQLSPILPNSMSYVGHISSPPWLQWFSSAISGSPRVVCRRRHVLPSLVRRHTLGWAGHTRGTSPRTLHRREVTKFHLLVLLFDTTDHIGSAVGPIHFFVEFNVELFGELAVLATHLFRLSLLQGQLLFHQVKLPLQLQVLVI